MTHSCDPAQSIESRPYQWLPLLIVLVTVVALAIGAFLLRYVERRLVMASGEELTLAAAEVAEKLDRLLFERYGDAHMLARAFSEGHADRRYLSDYLHWMKDAYAPVYLWLGVTDVRGRIVASTNPSLVGRDASGTPWFQQARDQRKVVVADVAVHEAQDGVETVAFTSPIIDGKRRFLGVVTTRVGIPMVENVVTRTIRSLERRDGFTGAVAYQILTGQGNVFADSDLVRKSPLNLRDKGVKSALLSDTGEPGYVEETDLRRHVDVVTGFAKTKGYGDYSGLGWAVLVRLDHEQIFGPIRSVLWKLGVAGAVIWLPLLVLLFWSTVRLRAQYREAQQESALAKAAEGALQLSQARIRAIVDTALDGVITIDAAGMITDWNDRAAAMFGWSREEAIGVPLAETVIPERHRAAHLRGLQNYLATGSGSLLNRRIEAVARRRDGHEFPVEIALSPARVGDAVIFSAFVRDITDRRRAERRLASQYAVSRVLAEARTFEEAGPKILQAVCESLEWELAVFWRVDKHTGSLRCLETWLSPSVKAKAFIEATWNAVFKPDVGLPGRIWSSGQPAWIANLSTDDNFVRAEAAAAVGFHSAFGFPIMVGKDVEGVVELFSLQTREPDEQLLNMVADIGLKIGQFGERAKAEQALHQTEAQLRQSQKMEAVGRLAGGVAHDFNNLLTVIRGYSELILNRLPPGDALRREMEEVKKAADRAAGLTGQLLAFSRRQFIAPKTLDLNGLIENMDGMLRRLLGEDIIELCTELDPETGMVKADPGQLEQVIMNLAVNARDAMPTGGRLTIQTGSVVVEQGTRRDAVPNEPGCYVMLAVRDTGHGMDEETQSHLFEPFFTTKEKGKGTGLGLSTVYGIVRQSGGSITVSSAPGRGTTFKIYFPCVNASAQDGDHGPAGADRREGRETILLVEDEPGVRGLVQETLRLQGYTVLEARHGIEALLTGAKHMGPIHLLLTDVVMPQMSGPEVAEKLAAVRPGLKVLYMSGYPDHPVFSKEGVKTDTAFLQKPFAPHVLVQKVREVLDGAMVS